MPPTLSYQSTNPLTHPLHIRLIILLYLCASALLTIAAGGALLALRIYLLSHRRHAAIVLDLPTAFILLAIITFPTLFAWHLLTLTRRYHRQQDADSLSNLRFTFKNALWFVLFLYFVATVFALLFVLISPWIALALWLFATLFFSAYLLTHRLLRQLSRR